MSSTTADRASGPPMSLPPELLLEIVEEVARLPSSNLNGTSPALRTLSTFSRVNKAWHTVANKSLYKCISLNSKPRSEQLAKLRRTLVRSPSLAGLVRELLVGAKDWKRLPNQEAKRMQAIEKRQDRGKDIWDILQVLPALKHLNVTNLEDLPKSYEAKLRKGVHFANLCTVKR